MSNSVYKRYGSQTVQGLPIPGKEDRMVQNNAGGYVFKVSDEQWFERFLVLGITDTLYNAKEFAFDKLMADGMAAFMAKNSGGRALDILLDVAKNDKAIRISPVLFAHAFLCKRGDEETRKRGYETLKDVVRIPTQLFEWIEYCEQLGGWSRSMRKAVNDWYVMNHSDSQLAYHLAKYRQRNGWTNRDVWNKSHIFSYLKTKADKQSYEKLLQFFYGEDSELLSPSFPAIVHGYMEAKSLNADELVPTIAAYGLTREMIPTEVLNTPQVQKALIPTMPLTALIRNLSTFSRVGLNNDSEVTQMIVEKLSSSEYLKKSHIHPFVLLTAIHTYTSGQGMRSSWSVNHAYTKALNEAFDKSFDFVEPTGKKILIGMDLSGSMSAPVVEGSNLSARSVAIAEALCLVKAEKENKPVVVPFTTQYFEANITPRDTFESACGKLSRFSGGTDTAQPFKYAIDKGIKDIDVFIIITDNETWAGNSHTDQLWTQYKKMATNKNVKMIVIGLCTTKFSVGDGTDPNVLNVAGFSADLPTVISKFIEL